MGHEPSRQPQDFAAENTPTTDTTATSRRDRSGPKSCRTHPQQKQPAFSPSHHHEVGRRPGDPGVIFLSISSQGMIPSGADQMAIGIGRRQFISALGGATVAWPVAARAQQLAMPIVGFLDPGGIRETNQYLAAAFAGGLKQAGYVEGQNVALEIGGPTANTIGSPHSQGNWYGVPSTVIATTSAGPRPFAVKNATTTIPIVFSARQRSGQRGSRQWASAGPAATSPASRSFANLLDAKRLDLLHLARSQSHDDRSCL